MPVAEGVDPRQAALENVLSSHSFARADQLKRFLRYVCEMEIAGRGREITEYTIATEALGRPASYAPLEDSVVRTTARTLRQKLALFYEMEMPAAELRIEIPKGMYAPRFVEWHSPGVPGPYGGGPARVDAAGWPAIRGWRPGWKSIAGIAFILLVAVGVALLGRVLPVAGSRVDPLVREAWAAMAGPGPTVLLCLSTPFQMMVRSVPDAAAPPGSYPFPEEFRPFRETFNRLQGRADAPNLFLEPSAVSTTLGETFAAVRAAQVLQSLGSDFKAVSARTVQIPVIAAQRTIVLGGPEYSRTTRQLLERGAYEIRYDPARREQVLQRHDRNDSDWRRTLERRNGSIVTSFGLITVLGNGPERPASAISMTGISSAGIQAAMEFFASPTSLARLKREMLREGIKKFPAAYQVVVRCTAYEDQMLSYHYEAHQVLDTTPPNTSR
ncbi:MAG TPA: hypothetical protein VLW65_08225 [Bryobacteraceae bacterium]|nr:hypothetical protein [Bryobacteraceae bacterium]